MAATQESVSTLAFFEYLFSKDEGYICIATTRPPAKRDTFSEQYFEWPSQKDELIEYIEKVRPSYNVYYGINILSVPKRLKENCIPQNLLWADLDACNPAQLEIPPQCVVESSPSRFQAMWRLDSKIDPFLAENYSKRIAYKYAELGADKSGHDLTQLFRVPGTHNFKYQLEEAPIVRVRAQVDELLPITLFDSLPHVDDYAHLPEIDVPELQDLPDPTSIMYRYQDHLKQTAFARYFADEPSKDWSKALWRLINTCFDVGMTAQETFVIAYNAKCNKYQRDGRPISHLWREVVKAESEHKSIEALLEDHRTLTFPALITAAEEAQLEETIIDHYMAWATEVTDAVPEFHEIACTMLMSSFMATTLRLKLKSGTVVPNLWAMILGESTLTRKTTAMNMAMDFIFDIDKDLILASDASAEGLMSALATRPRQVSIFYRDEVTGFFDAMNRKEYMASLPETLTKMYDVPKYLARKLKKDTYAVVEPIFIFFGGGVPDKMYSLLQEEHFASGFIPRFLVMRGHGSTERLRPTGPPDARELNKRENLLSTFQAYHSMYTDQHTTMTIPTGETIHTTPEIEVIFEDKVWSRVATIESQMMEAAENSPEASRALPMFSRMFTSMLKLAMLFAASRQEPISNLVKGEMRDILQAAFYIQKWGKHAVDLIQNSGATSDETKLRAVYRTIERHPGIMRGIVMQRHHLSAPTMDVIEKTLVQRLQVQVTPKNSGSQYWPIGK